MLFSSSHFAFRVLFVLILIQRRKLFRIRQVEEGPIFSSKCQTIVHPLLRANKLSPRFLVHTHQALYLIKLNKVRREGKKREKGRERTKKEKEEEILIRKYRKRTCSCTFWSAASPCQRSSRSPYHPREYVKRR